MLLAETTRAAEELRRRRQRERLFGSEFFADPAWDILLDLFVSEETAKTTSISNACIASAVPATTALRYLSALEEAGLVHRVRDDRDRRRVLIRLTEDARSKMIAYLQAGGLSGSALADRRSSGPT